MNALVIDASIAVKWVVEEDGTQAALALRARVKLIAFLLRPRRSRLYLALRARVKLIAPDLLVAECANILWKKVQRGELPKDEAILGARLLERSDIELLPMRSLLATATRMAVELDHPAYDCLYLALAIENACRFVTADERFIRKLAQTGHDRFLTTVVSLTQAAADLQAPNPSEGR